MNNGSKFVRVPAYYMIPDRSGHWISDGCLDFKSELFDCYISINPFALNNLSSIPWFARKFINPNGPHRPAAALHDMLYELQGETQGWSFTRKECDQLYLEAMLSDKKAYFDALPKNAQSAVKSYDLAKHFSSNSQLTKKWMAYSMYAGVRLFGWLYWDRAK